MKTKHFLNEVCKQINYEPAVELIAEELQSHIEDIKSEYMCKGYKEKEAEEKAVEQMGDAKQIGKRLNKMHGPKLDWKLLILISILMFFGILSAAILFKSISQFTPGGLFENKVFRQYIIALAIGSVLSGIIYFMDYKKISKYSFLLYTAGIILNLFCYVSNDWEIEFLYSTIPFYTIAFAGFINEINQKKSNIIKIIILSIISLILLRKTTTIALRITELAYLSMITVQLLKRNKIKYIVMLWIIPIILISSTTYQIAMNIKEHPDLGTGTRNARNELIHSAELIGTVNDPRRNSNDTTASDFINSSYDFLSLLAQYGWIVSVGMVLTVISLCIKLIINAISIKDTYGKMIIINITIIYILQSLCNIWISFGPGILSDTPIPLVTFGVTNLIVNMMCMALLLSIYRRKNGDFNENVNELRII